MKMARQDSVTPIDVRALHSGFILVYVMPDAGSSARQGLGLPCARCTPAHLAPTLVLSRGLHIHSQLEAALSKACAVASDAVSRVARTAVAWRW